MSYRLLSAFHSVVLRSAELRCDSHLHCCCVNSLYRELHGGESDQNGTWYDHVFDAEYPVYFDQEVFAFQH